MVGPPIGVVSDPLAAPPCCALVHLCAGTRAARRRDRSSPPLLVLSLRLPRSHPIAGMVAAFFAVCAPAAASSPVSVTPLKRCYVSVAAGSTEPVDLSASGFHPNAAVDVRLDGTRVATVTSGADGRLQARVNPPHQRRGERSFRLELQQRDDPGHRARVSSRVTALAVRLRPRVAPPTSVVTWRGRGFTAPGPVVVHHVKDGEARSTVRLATPRGACGRFRARRAQFPFRPSLGAWVLQVDQQQAFAPIPATPFVQLPVTVQRVSGDS